MTHDEIIEQQAADYLVGAAELMDDEIREAIHMEFAPCSARVFVEEYSRRHLAKFGEEFKG
jgi:anti-CRISPR protein AcrIC5